MVELHDTHSAKGWGLVATKHIPKDTYLMDYVGEYVSEKEVQKRDETGPDCKTLSYLWSEKKCKF